MLTNQQGNKSRGRNDITTESSNRILGLLVMLGFSATLLYTFGRARFLEIQDNLFEIVEPSSTIQTIGAELMTNYVLPFEVSGILLMAVLIGAAYLSTKTKN